MAHTVNWRVDPETLTFRSAFDGYDLTISSGVHNAVVWGSVVQRGSRQFRGQYTSVPEAMTDLVRRAAAQYFVPEDDPTFHKDFDRAPQSAYSETSTKEEPVSTSEEPERRQHVVILFKNAEGKYEWIRKAGNGEPISDSANHGYIHKADALHGMRLANQDVDNYRVEDTTTEGEGQA